MRSGSDTENESSLIDILLLQIFESEILQDRLLASIRLLADVGGECNLHIFSFPSTVVSKFDKWLAG